MEIVEVARIPTKEDTIDVPLDDLMQVYKVCRQMEVLCDLERGIGLSAVQVGLPWKLFLVKGNGTCPLVPKGKFGYFLNCNYEKVTDETVVSIEGCLSLRSPDGRLRSFKVERSNVIRICGYRLLEDSDSQSGLKIVPIDQVINVDEEGIVFQHEIDHHNGILISEIGDEIFFVETQV